MKHHKPEPTPPGPRVSHNKDPFMNLDFNLGLLVCVAMLLIALYRLVTGAMAS